MSEIAAFNGFPRELIQFYQDLSRNNAKSWFNEHKDIYRRHVIAPAQAFVVSMGERLRLLSPGIVADTRASGAGSIFRIYRDLRFSKDKQPYKTFLGIFFWEGNGKKMENPGFYFHLEPDNLMLGVGMHTFPRPLLDTYRDSVAHREHGVALAQAIGQVSAKGPYHVGGRHYKRIPAGYDADHKNANFLLHNGLHASTESPIPEELFSESILDYCFDRFEDMASIHHWLVAMMERA
jgi:uncharacterized protein (TIGR02453 family)